MRCCRKPRDHSTCRKNTENDRSISSFSRRGSIRRVTSFSASAASFALHFFRAPERSSFGIFSTSSSISTQRFSRKPSSESLAAKMPSIWKQRVMSELERVLRSFSPFSSSGSQKRCPELDLHQEVRRVRASAASSSAAAISAVAAF